MHNLRIHRVIQEDRTFASILALTETRLKYKLLSTNNSHKASMFVIMVVILGYSILSIQCLFSRPNRESLPLNKLDKF